jgi:hypothetical protein
MCDDHSGSETERHPHKPTPIVVNEVNHTLVLEESGQLGDRQFVVDATDRPLYDLLMEVLHEAHAHCPDHMPAALADHCDDLLDVRDTVMDIERGRVLLEGYAQYGMSYCHNVRDAIDEWRDRQSLTLVVVGCSASKHDVDEAVPAKELYRGSYWSCKRDYAETIGDDWRICSAKHALLDPDNEIEHYNRSVGELEHVPVHADLSHRLPDGRAVQTKLDQWAGDVYDSLSRWLRFEAFHGSVDPRDAELEVLLGRSYRDPLEERGVFDRLRARGGLEIAFPFQEEEDAQGGNGNQMGWMTDEVEAATEAMADGGRSVDTASEQEGSR